LVGGFESFEELFVAFDVLAAVSLHTGVYGAFRAFVGK
jgi:hypothetical protein